ncbi:MAG: hypothetical protein IH784_02710 [Bacteroidetes bacterium]|nr:hypothetical protein [Bacteroidota bacterium]
MKLKNMKLSVLLILAITSSVYSQQQTSFSTLLLEQEVKSSASEYSSANLNFSDDLQTAKKSAGLAILYSLLLPGMGELYADGYESGKYFTIAEGVLWGTYIGMSVYASNQEDNYKAYATTNASINTSGKDDDYFATIGQFENIDEYNDQKALERNFNQMYNTETFFWKWQNTEERRTYRSMWSSSEQTSNDLRFVVGAMILNRVVSAINAVRLVSAYNNRIEEELSWNVSIGLEHTANLPTSINFSFQTTF